MDDQPRRVADESLHATGAQDRRAAMAQQARRSTNRTILFAGVTAAGAVVLALVAIDASAEAKAVVGLAGLAAVALGVLVALGLRRYGGEWAQPALLMGVDGARRRRVRRALTFGGSIEPEDMELVDDLRKKLARGRWVLLVSMGWLCVLGPLRLAYNTDLPAIFRWLLLFVPLGVWSVGQAFWMYNRAGRVLEHSRPRIGPPGRPR